MRRLLLQHLLQNGIFECSHVMHMMARHLEPCKWWSFLPFVRMN